MRILVTGGAGFVGSHIAEEALRRGHEVTVWDNPEEGHNYTPPNAEFIRRDIRALGGLCDRADVVIHAAAYADLRHNFDPERGFDNRLRLVETNIVGTAAVVEYCLRVKPAKLINLSSASVYGPFAPDLVEEDYATPTTTASPYAASKLAAEAIVESYLGDSKTSFYNFRLVNVVGARSRRGVIADFVAMAKQGHIHAADNGRYPKNWVHVQDVAEACLHVAEHAENYSGPFNIASTERWSWRDIVDVMRDEAPDNVFELTWEDKNVGAVGDPIDLNVSTADALNLLGWHARHSVRAGVVECLQWHGWGTC